ncbi:helix-turn-helix transcriptional regulator [Sphaerisporangium sp. NPDC088356]|uniref:helix-turn-helix domain-containing protein n=1 Tax=Sphaerisporangium sp. NPDC088356 TaxID=3154871 RepID=UPI00342FBA63
MANASIPTVRSRRLGRTLRRFREERSLTLEEAGALMERSVSSLSKIENGRVRIPSRDIRVILDVYGVVDERIRETLVDLARDSHKRGWWRGYGDVLSWAYLDFISLEADAAAVRNFEIILIPGLLQTADYARAIMDALPASCGRQDIEQLVDVRIKRQQVLYGASPLHLWAIVDEAALHRHFGGRETMRAQLHALVEAARLENVTVQVLPFGGGAYSAVDGAFTILEFSEISDLDVVLVENLTSGLYMEEDEEVRQYNVVFDHLRASALSVPDSLALIEQVVNNL